MSPKTKIFYFITKGNFGGAQRYVYELATNLPPTEFEVTIITGQGKTLRNKLTRVGRRVIEIETLDRDIHFFDDLRSFWIIWRLLRREKPDIIHLNSSKIGGLGALAGRLAGTPKIVFTVHGLAFNEGRPGGQKILIKIIHWLSLILSHQIITVANCLKDQIINWPGLKSKIVNINNGLSPIRFFERSVSRREIWPKHEAQTLTKKFWIGTISELHKNKGLDWLIEAFALTVRAMLSNSLGWSLQLVIIGDGEEKERLNALIKSKHLEDRIYLAGRIEDARTYLKAFDIFTLTSRTEAFPYSLLEAGAASLPVVASEIGGIPEIIPDSSVGILVPPGNIEEIKKSLLYLIKHSPYRKQIGLNLKKRVSSDFSLKQMIEKTLVLYRQQ